MWRTAQRERLGHDGQERRAEVPAGRDEQLEELVERLRVGAVVGDERPGRSELRRCDTGRVPRPAADLGAVAPDRVDLAVVGDRPERLGKAPGRLGVRRVALVEEGVPDADPRSPQVRVEVREAGARDEALVDDRPARGRRNGDDVAQPRTLEGGVAERGPPGVERAADERLDERWATGPGRATERIGVRRDRPPAQDLEPVGRETIADEPAGRSVPGAGTGPRQEELDDGRAILGKPAPGREGLDDRRVERDRHAGAVGRCAVCAERATVGEGGQTAEGEGQDVGKALAAGVGDESDAARVVFERRVVEGRDRVTRGDPIAPGGRGSGRARRTPGSLWRFDGHWWNSVGASAEVEPTAREEPDGRSPRSGRPGRRRLGSEPPPGPAQAYVW